MGEGKNIRRIKIFITFFTIMFWVMPQGFIAAKAMDVYDVSSVNSTSTAGTANITNIANTNSSDNSKQFVKGEVIIKYKNASKPISTMAVKGQRKKLSSNSELVKLSDNVNVEDAVNKIKQDNNVELVQPNYIYKVNSISADTLADQLWGLYNDGQAVLGDTGLNGVDINVKNAWTITKGSSDVVVGVVDTGIDINQPDLKDRIWVNSGEIPGNGIDDDHDGYVDDVNGWNFYDNTNNVYDNSTDDLHGTHVGGIIAASENGEGVIGVAPNIKIMPLKFIGPDGGTTADAISAIDYAKSKGVKIINASWGGGDYDEALKDAIANSGALFVCAAGNDSSNNDDIPTYPADFHLSNMITVASVDNTGKLSSFSNYGANTVDVAAPGENILSTIPWSYSYYMPYGYLSGTSMATPYVSGVAALLLSDGVTNPADIKARIMQTVKPLDDLSGKVASGGIVDAYGALIGRPEYDRYAGADRYDTCAKIAEAGWKTSQVAVLTNGENFADALSAAPLAKKYNAPILLTNSSNLPTSIENEIDRLKVNQVFIIGGTGAVSANIENKLKAKNIAVTRLCGSDRYETSEVVANAINGNNEVIVAYGEGFADELSISSIAAAKQIPILLVKKDQVPSAINKYIAAHNITKTYVIGGTGVVSDDVMSQFPSPERICGSDRYATNVAVLNRFSSDLNLNTVYFAYGLNYPDALSASQLAAATLSPIVLVDNSLSPVIKQYIDDNKSQIQYKHAAGGTGSILNNTFIRLFN